MSKLLPFDSVRSHTIFADDYLVFGGMFDPIHAGHLTVIKAAFKLFRRVYIAPASRNPWKDSPAADFDLRCRMIELVLRYEKLNLQLETTDPASAAVIIDRFKYEFVEEYVLSSRKTRSGRIFWGVGADSEESVPKWRNWDLLDLPCLVFPVVIEVHSSLIRAKAEGMHPAIDELAKEHRLYQYA